MKNTERQKSLDKTKWLMSKGVERDLSYLMEVKADLNKKEEDI